MVAYLYRGPVSIPGAITREPESATVEDRVVDSTTYPTAFGVPVKVVSGKIQPVASGDAATVIYGMLVRSFPDGASFDALGTSTPPTKGIVPVLKRGYIGVHVNAGTASLYSTVYVRVANAATGKPIGGIEAAADSSNTVIMSGAYFTGAADSSGYGEIAFNI